MPIKPIVEILDLADEDKNELLELIDDKVQRCRNAGDLLGAGEWLASKLPYVTDERVEEVFIGAVALWASPIEFKLLPPCIDDLLHAWGGISTFLWGQKRVGKTSVLQVLAGELQLGLWLKQFDDDIRIELAFNLLRRLAEKGCISEGAKSRALEKLQEAVQAARLEIGSGAWKVIKGRRDDLCITFVDSEMKSGAATARELAKRLRPGT